MNKTNVVYCVNKIFQTIFRYSSTFNPRKPTCQHSKKIYHCSRLSKKDIKAFHNRFYGIPKKSVQDAFILKHCTVSFPQRCRIRTGARSNKSMTIKYFITGRRSHRQMTVCRSTFLQILGIEKDRVQHVMKHYLEIGQQMLDKRGGDRCSEANSGKKKAVMDFIMKIYQPTTDTTVAKKPRTASTSPAI